MLAQTFEIFVRGEWEHCLGSVPLEDTEADFGAIRLSIFLIRSQEGGLQNLSRLHFDILDGRTASIREVPADVSIIQERDNFFRNFFRDSVFPWLSMSFPPCLVRLAQNRQLHLLLFFVFFTDPEILCNSLTSQGHCHCQTSLQS